MNSPIVQRTLFLSTLLFVLTSCATTEVMQCQILSDPPGARIEINGNYVGDTPLTVPIPMSKGRFTQTTKIRALPRVPGQYTQSKLFMGGFDTLPNDPVPGRIFFDMRLGPVSPEINVNVNP